MKNLFVVLVLLLTNSFSYGQGSHSLTGTVIDGNNLPVSGAGIYVSGYKMVTVTDKDGNFKFSTMDPGNYDILVQSIGYLPGKKSITIKDKPVKIIILLETSTTAINEVTILSDAARQRYIGIFREYFIGTTLNSRSCKILNPEVLSIDFNKKENILKVSTNDFLIIENAALGYKIKYLIEHFEYNPDTRIVYYEGYPTYEEMEGSKRKKRKWAAAREIAYKGSNQHFYRALSSNTATADGFIVHKLVNIPNKDRLPDSLINANLKRLSRGTAGSTRTLTMNGNDSLSYWIRMKEKPKTLSVLNRQIIKTDTLVHTYNEDLKYINFTDDLYVLYTREKEPENFFLSGYRLSRPFDVSDVQISQVKALKLPVAFYRNGGLSDPTSTIVSGYWAYEKIADQVPMDYLSGGQ